MCLEGQNNNLYGSLSSNYESGDIYAPLGVKITYE